MQFCILASLNARAAQTRSLSGGLGFAHSISIHGLKRMGNYRIQKQYLPTREPCSQNVQTWRTDRQELTHSENFAVTLSFHLSFFLLRLCSFLVSEDKDDNTDRHHATIEESVVCYLNTTLEANNTTRNMSDKPTVDAKPRMQNLNSCHAHVLRTSHVWSKLVMMKYLQTWLTCNACSTMPLPSIKICHNGIPIRWPTCFGCSIVPPCSIKICQDGVHTTWEWYVPVCHLVFNQDISSRDASNVTDMQWMFHQAAQLK
jgi:hypothetical protein